ncbi:hypothetical protein [Sulfitobacter aestuariivivens]|uniref:hypothetical protein n=1 Tax=Sulfitobacter aestuariivivens TaxID=2766981 RepID=UPI00360B0A94
MRAQIINGAPLRYNWDHSGSAEGVDARTVLAEGGTTHLILTEAIPLDGHLQWSETSLFAQAFAGLALSARPDARVYVQETWHSLKSGTGVAVEHDPGADVAWRIRLDRDLPKWEHLVAQVAAVRGANEDRVGLIPAGQAMARLYDQIAAGEVAGLTDIAALFSDDIHLSDLGHYFVAMVQYATLTGQSPLGLPTDFSDRWGTAFDAPDPDLARALQRIAWEAVQAYGGAVPAPPPVATQPARAVTAPAVPTGPPVIPVQGQAVAVDGTPAIGIGLAAVTDWSTQQPFIDVMKTARPWIGHKPGQFGGMELEALRAEGYLDDAGWPVRMPPELSSIGTLILTDMPPDAVSLKGRYVLRYEGTGVIEVAGRAERVRYGKNEVTFDYAPGAGGVEIRIQRINTTDPPRNISVVHADNLDRLREGVVFNPAWTAKVGQLRLLRFMDWMQTNNSTQSVWADRPRPADVTYQGGVPAEVMIALANELEKDVWFNMPHLADDAYVRAFATLVRDTLDPELEAYVEFSNEVWNWQFGQARWADVTARARWSQKDKWMQAYGLRAARVAQIWSEVFGDEAEARLVNVVSSQTGWPGLESEALNAPLAVAEGEPKPVESFDAYAVTGYFGGVLGREDREGLVMGWLEESQRDAEAAAQAQGLEGQAASAYIAAHRYDTAVELAERELRDGALSGDRSDTLADLVGRVWPYHAGVAQAHGLDLVVYEGAVISLASAVRSRMKSSPRSSSISIIRLRWGRFTRRCWKAGPPWVGSFLRITPMSTIRPNGAHGARCGIWMIRLRAGMHWWERHEHVGFDPGT